VICENASGIKRRIDLRTLRLLREAGRVAKMIQRRKDQAVTRVMLLAEPNEIATRITAQAEVVELGKTWVHTRNLGLFSA
jgi:transcription initiation factor IIE alpha subunit